MGLHDAVLVVCDRCGKRKNVIPVPKEYTITNIKEKSGFFRKCINEDYRWLCPDCNEQYVNMLNKFMDGRTVNLYTDKEAE